MLGGLNKLFRNVASLQGKNAFDKCLIKATYSGDMKEPKEKHLVFILECMKGKHLELIRPKDALAKIFDRFFNNLRSFTLIIKSLIILHRALQEEEISQMVAHKIKEKENLLFPFQNEEQTYDTKMQTFICELYISYIKNLISFIIICQLFSISLKDLRHYTQSLQHQELFLIFSRIDGLIESILKVFEQKQYCQTLRILQSVIYLVFVDLLQIYQSYYLLITVMLEKFEEMNLKDAKRAFIIYLNFLRINKEIRKMASSIIQEFSIKIGIAFYDIDTKVIEALKQSIEVKEKEKLFMKGAVTIGSARGYEEDYSSGVIGGQQPDIAHFPLDQMTSPMLQRGNTTSGLKHGFTFQQNPKESNTDQKPNTSSILDEYQGGQGVQRRKGGRMLKKGYTVEEEFKNSSHQDEATSQTNSPNLNPRTSAKSNSSKQIFEELTMATQQIAMSKFQKKENPLTSGKQTLAVNHPISSGLNIELHQMSIASQGFTSSDSSDADARKSPSIRLRKQSNTEQASKFLKPSQPILVKQDSVSPRAKHKTNHKVKFSENYEETTFEPKMPSSRRVSKNEYHQENLFRIPERGVSENDNDLDDFKSIVVRDDMRVDFFEALEGSPQYPFDSYSPRNKQMQVKEDPLDQYEQKEQEANGQVNMDESFLSCLDS